MYPTSLVIRRVSVSVLLVLFVLFMGLPMPAQVEEPVDLDAVHRIKDEGLNRSEVMDLASYLTDVYGPRLTGSPNIRMAGDYARSKLVEWELVNAELEEWGPFGRGWTNDRFSAHLTIMGQSYPVIGISQGLDPWYQWCSSGRSRSCCDRNTGGYRRIQRPTGWKVCPDGIDARSASDV